MKAIDFATYFCQRLLHADISLIEASTLCAIAAGLEHVPDIAQTLGMPAGNVATTGHRLVKKGFIHAPNWTDEGRPLYRLTSEGKEIIRTHFLSFLHP